MHKSRPLLRVLIVCTYVCFCRELYDAGSLWNCTPLVYAVNTCPLVYDPTSAAAVSAGSQVDLELWPTHATSSVDPNDNGVYCATTPGYAIDHTLTHHAAVVAVAASIKY